MIYNVAILTTIQYGHYGVIPLRGVMASEGRLRYKKHKP
jgi:hypothetical protein